MHDSQWFDILPQILVVPTVFLFIGAVVTAYVVTDSPKVSDAVAVYILVALAAAGMSACMVALKYGEESRPAPRTPNCIECQGPSC